MNRPVIKQDPFTKGARVHVIAGEHTGKLGTVVRAYRGRTAGLNRIYVEIDGGPFGWSVSFQVEDLEVER